MKNIQNIKLIMIKRYNYIVNKQKIYQIWMKLLKLDISLKKQDMGYLQKKIYIKMKLQVNTLEFCNQPQKMHLIVGNIVLNSNNYRKSQ